MALHTFVAGDVLEAQQLNDSFAAVGGLKLISTTTIGSAVSSVQVTNAFSATFDAYKIIVTGGASSANDRLEMILGATTTGYSMQFIYGSYSNASAAAGSTNQAKWLYAGGTSTTSISMDVDLLNPYLTELTFISARNMESSLAGIAAGYLNNSTSYTDFTISPKTGTITGGEIRVYGYQN